VTYRIFLSVRSSSTPSWVWEGSGPPEYPGGEYGVLSLNRWTTGPYRHRHYPSPTLNARPYAYEDDDRCVPAVPNPQPPANLEVSFQQSCSCASRYTLRTPSSPHRLHPACHPLSTNFRLTSICQPPRTLFTGHQLNSSRKSIRVDFLSKVDRPQLSDLFCTQLNPRRRKHKRGKPAKSPGPRPLTAIRNQLNQFATPAQLQ
jgi:hypothetical protein